jgi:glycerol-3-phosphate dehydrogenase
VFESPESAVPSPRRSASEPFDLAVIGGGITGAGVARDAALRGLNVILFEREDFASGTTGRNLTMIHGGPRYLESAPHVTKESCEESAIIQRIAPDVVFRVPFLRVVMPGDTRPLRELDAFFSEYDRFHVLKNGVKHCVLTGDEARKVEPRLSREVTSAVSFDEFAAHPQRLTWLNLMDARAHGAVLHNHAPVTGFKVERGAIVAVKVRIECHEREFPVKAVVNAT